MIYTLIFCGVCLLVIPMLRPVVGLFSSDQRVIDGAMTALSRLRVALIGVCVWQALVETYMALGTSAKSALMLVVCTAVGIAVAHMSDGDAIQRVTRGMAVDQLLKACVVCALLPISFFGVVRRLDRA
jgi:hypothetical protein